MSFQLVKMALSFLELNSRCQLESFRSYYHWYSAATLDTYPLVLTNLKNVIPASRSKIKTRRTEKIEDQHHFLASRVLEASQVPAQYDFYFLSYDRKRENNTTLIKIKKSNPVQRIDDHRGEIEDYNHGRMTAIGLAITSTTTNKEWWFLKSCNIMHHIVPRKYLCVLGPVQAEECKQQEVTLSTVLD